MKHEDADYHHIMKLHGLSDFGAYVSGEWVEPKIIEIERDNDYAEHQYLLYLKKKESLWKVQIPLSWRKEQRRFTF